MANRFWVGDGGNWSDNANHWSASTGGAPNASKPTSSDNVFFDVNSFSAGAQTVTQDEPANCLDMDWTNATNSPTLNKTGGSTNIYGNLTFITAMTVSGDWRTRFYSTSTGKTITTAGRELTSLQFLGVGGGWTLQDDVTIGTGGMEGAFIVSNGTVNTNGKTITCLAFNISGANTRALTLGASVVNCTSWTATTITNLTLTANTATIKVTGTGAFAGGGITTYNIVELNGTAHTISGSNTFNRLTIGRPGGAVAISGAVICTLTEFSIPIVGTTVVTITDTDFVMLPGRIVSDYLVLSGSRATGGASFYAGSNSTDNGGNVGWLFHDPEGVEIAGVIVVTEKGKLLIENRIEERSTASFVVVDTPGTASYQQGQPVLIYDPDDVLIFGGVIDAPETRRYAPSGELLHPIRCKDWHYLADKRLVAASYTSQTAGFIVDDIFDNYLADEGVTIGLIEAGPTLVEAIFNYVRVSDAFDALAEKAGKTWWIDENKALYFQDRDVTAAPWSATGDDFLKKTTKMSGANPKYRNRQYIRGGRGTTSSQVEIFTGDGVNVAFTVGYPIVSVPTVTVNAVGQTVGIKGLDTTKDCYWNKGDATVTFDTGSIPGAVAVVITYFGQFDILVLAEDLPEIAAQLAIEGAGTGIVEDIDDEPTLNDSDASIDSAQAKLARFGVTRTAFTFQTVRTGLKVGQELPVSYPAFGLSDNMLIESVKIRSTDRFLTYFVTALIGPTLGGWANLFKSLADMKSEVIERLNVGSNQILIILVVVSESWEQGETVAVTVYACPVVALTLFPSLTTFPC